MSDPLTWIAAVGGVAATVGAWLGPVRTRWQWRAEHARTDEARRDNELHRRRFAEVWNWQRNQPEGPERIDAARWYGEWTGAARPGEAALTMVRRPLACTVLTRMTPTSGISSSSALSMSPAAWEHPSSRCEDSYQTDLGHYRWPALTVMPSVCPALGGYARNRP